jgi:sugar fermentation stimulation protein A
MNYKGMVQGWFEKRPNRFVAHVRLAHGLEVVHVKNTGRCAELLQPDRIVYLEKATNPDRKTRFSLITVEKILSDGQVVLVNMDSQVPNDVVEEALRARGIPEVGQVTFLKREATLGRSRFDFYYETEETKGYIEVKGVTLEEDGVARFPDAPTLRGAKQVRALDDLQEEGFQNVVLFLVQMKGPTVFEPNDEMDPAFGEALRKAHANGVAVLCYDAHVETDSIRLGEALPVNL